MNTPVLAPANNRMYKGFLIKRAYNRNTKSLKFIATNQNVRLVSDCRKALRRDIDEHNYAGSLAYGQHKGVAFYDHSDMFIEAHEIGQIVKSIVGVQDGY
jgi:hypothetical protein